MDDIELEKHRRENRIKALKRLADRALKAKLKRRIGSGDQPPENDLNKLSQAVYKGRNDIPGYELLEAIPTIGIYKQIASNTIVIAVRGSADTQDWITNAQLPFNNLVNTARYKTDKEFVMNAVQKYGPGNDVYITGHSLGGMVAEQLKRDFDQIKSGITFNPAFESQDLFNREESTVKRRYTSEDPLGIIGQNLKGAEVEAPKKDERSLFEKGLSYLSPAYSAYDFFGRKLKGHKLTEFESRKGGIISDEPGDPIIPFNSILDVIKRLSRNLSRSSQDVLHDLFGDNLERFEIVAQNLPKLIDNLFNNNLESPYAVKLLDQIYDLYIVSYIGKLIEINKNNYDANDITLINDTLKSLKSQIIQNIKRNDTDIPIPSNNIPSFSNLIEWVNKESGIIGFGEKVVMDKKTYVKEHKNLIKLLEKAGKEGKKQKKELKKELKGGVIERDERKLIDMTWPQIQKMAENEDEEKVMLRNRNRLREKLQYRSGIVYAESEADKYKPPSFIPTFKEPLPAPSAPVAPAQPAPKPAPAPAPPAPKPAPKPEPAPYVSPPPNLSFRDQIIAEIFADHQLLYTKYNNNPKLPTDPKMIYLGFEKRGNDWYKDGKKIKRPVVAKGESDGYALHAIIIKKKGYNKNDAELEANKFKTEKGMFMRETKLSYRFRNIPKTKFEPKTYRTKKINKDISLIYGKLK
jgi:hypothetical protein